MKKISLIFLLAIICLNGLSQSYSGQVLDSENKLPISYVSIGIPAKGVGTLTDDEGRFSFNCGEGMDKDSIVFSMIGYESSTFSMADFKKNFPAGIARVYLGKKSINLNEVVIKPKKTISKILGKTISNVRPEDCASLFVIIENLSKEYGDSSAENVFTGKYMEFGTLFKIKKRDTYIEKVQFQFCEVSADSIPLRLNIYSNIRDQVKLGLGTILPKYDQVLQQPINFKINKNTTKLEIDLKAYNLMVKGDFMVTIETLEPADYEKIKTPGSASLGGEPLIIKLNRTTFTKIPLVKIGTTATISYSK